MAAKKSTKKKPPSKPKDGQDVGMEDVFTETAEQDAEDVKQGAAAKRVKQCFLLAMEAQMLLQCARKETATSAIIDAELRRVIELAKEMKEEAKAARKALQL